MKHVFLCGDPALDLCATLRSRRTVRFETLTSTESLDSWYREAAIADVVAPCQESDLARAVAVREAIYALVTARIAGDGYGADALALVNGAARVPAVTPQLTAAGRHSEAAPAEALSTVARHAVEVVGGADAPLLKECGNPECTKIYIDRSHGARREWCGMDPCGNRMKAAAYRARKKQTR